MKPSSLSLHLVVALLAIAAIVPGCKKHRSSSGPAAPVAPTITGPASPLAPGVETLVYGLTFLATGDPTITWSITAGALPGGMTLNPATGSYSGTPTLAGTYNFTVTATNAVGADSDPYVHVIASAIPVITAPASPLANGLVGTAFPATTFTATGLTPITWSITAGAMPGGMTLDVNTGLYSGTPTTSGIFNFTVTATNGAGTDNDPYMHTIVQAPTITAPASPLVDGVLSVAYPATNFTATGDPVITWSITAGALPGGMTLDVNTGVYSGTPTAAGVFNFTVTATNGAGADSDPYVHTILAAPVAPTITGPASPLTIGAVGITYPNTNFTATGTAPITWSITAGAMPGGMTLDVNTGLYSGTPTTAGTFNFTVTATNGAGADSDPYVHTIGTPPTITAPASPLTPGFVGFAFGAVNFTATGDPTILWTITAGALPGGITLDTNTGVYSGTPTTAGTFNFTVTATNSLGADSDPYVHVINTPVAPTITAPASPLTPGTVGTPYPAANFTATGTAPITWSITAGALPGGMTLDTNTGVYSGTPTTAGTFNFTVTATNGAGTDNDPYVHVINAAATASTPEVEANDTSGTANTIVIGTPGTGSLVTAGDIDFWTFTATAGTDIEFEVSANRRDQAAWSTPGNLIRATVFAADGTTQLLITSATLFGFGNLDLDLPVFRVPTTGSYFLRLDQVTPGNTGGLYAFTIKTLTLPGLQTEAEAPGATGVNDTFGTAQAITPGTVFGYHTSGNLDFYSFVVAAPTIVRFAMSAYRNGVFGPQLDYYDPIINLLDTNGATVLKTDDDDIFFDSGLAYQINTPGIYFIQITEFAASEGPYYLSFESTAVGVTTESEPNQPAPGTSNAIAYGSVISGTVVAADDDFFSFTGTAGDMVYVQVMAGSANLQGAPLVTLPTSSIVASDGITVVTSTAEGGDLRFRRTILRTSGTFFVRLTTASVTALPYTLRLILQQASGFEVEANGTIGTANAIPGSGRISGAVNVAADVDTFSFTAIAGELVILSLQGGAANAGDLATWGSTITPVMTVLDGLATTLATANTTATRLARGTITGVMRIEIAFVAPSAGTYFVQITDAVPAATDYYTLIKR